MPRLVDGERSSTLQRNGLQPKASFTAFARLARALQVKPGLLSVGQGDPGCSRIRSRPDACQATWSAFSCCTMAMSGCNARAELVASALASPARKYRSGTVENGHSLSVLLFPHDFALPRTWASLCSEDYIVAHM
jgi:hypothetical protein